MNKKRIVVLDTETTGISSLGLPHTNHRIIEIGAVEIINRRFTGNNFHVYIQPNRLIDTAAFKIHGISNNFLLDKPSFKDISDTFLKYINGSELVIHNASFDVGFINQELEILKNNINIEKIDTICSIIDTLKIARKLFPGKKNTLDALCKRYKINKSQRNLHSAIIDANLLGRLYLLMTGGQESMFFDNKNNNKNFFQKIKHSVVTTKTLKILNSTQKEILLHKEYLKYMEKNSICLWNKFFHKS
ncbi:MAG: DNA polymerase III subunit epsilon [Buchnera aphidicola (Brevicoryne brassicae)]|uniref:DNA polymerase III subunit epsilon n=1 Tax=Buchnera aphidicola (Brevicoryne brassicae) TaxID=911343 RepID=A0AAJ5PVV5_9GAMM|nr:DNA polymerase III subunit epsilon [Buchnera aphidicola]WAI19237.1 MAG: DNA polymerase III subunit epsilon [Buchnera aphidicola (Brevicoryne brassicae)]